MRLGGEIETKLATMSEYYSMRVPEVIRMAINQYHDKIYRVGRFGQQSGSGPRSEKQSEIEKFDQFVIAKDSDGVIRFLREIGYIGDKEETFNCTFYFGNENPDDPTTPKGLIVLPNNESEVIPRYLYSKTEDLRAEVVKLLKNNK